MLELTITKRIGRRAYHFKVSGKNLHETVTEAERLSFPDVPACGICGSDNLELTARVAQDKFKYVSVKCADCRADVTFGKRQDDEHTYFLRKNDAGALDWRAYEPREAGK